MIDKNDSTWWQRAVFYQIYPRSYMDSNGDGIGDLKGIEQKIPYLKELGIDALWISPFFKSPMKDFGYDISDYCDIDPMFGTMDDFKSLLKTAHEQDIRIIVDLVVNHSSDQHPWFQEARKSKDNPFHNYYIWKPITDNKKPNNWICTFELRSAWHKNEATNEWYLGTFTKHQPEFDWRNPKLQEEIWKVVRFWLDLGADGFRMDVATGYFKDEQFRSNPFSPYIIPDLLQKHLYDRNQPEFHDAFKEFRRITDSYGDRMLIGETHGLDPKVAAASYGQNNDELHMAFNFDFLFTKWGAAKFKASADNWYKVLPKNAWPNFTLSNHDQKRHFSRYAKGADSEKRARVAAAMLLCLRGTPFIYYGEEIGMTCQKLPRKVLQDPLGISVWPIDMGRDPERTPMQWTGAKDAGFGSETPWLPINPDYKTKNVEAQKKDPQSLWNWYHNLIMLRKSEKALQSGSQEWLPSPTNVMAWTRKLDNTQIDVFLNFSNSTEVVELSGGYILAGTNKKAGEKLSSGKFELEPYATLIIKR